MKLKNSSSNIQRNFKHQPPIRHTEISGVKIERQHFSN